MDISWLHAKLWRLVRLQPMIFQHGPNPRPKFTCFTQSFPNNSRFMKANSSKRQKISTAHNNASGTIHIEHQTVCTSSTIRGWTNIRKIKSHKLKSKSKNKDNWTTSTGFLNCLKKGNRPDKSSGTKNWKEFKTRKKLELLDRIQPR